MSFAKLLDKATSGENLDPDWEAILQICDKIRMKDPPAKKAFAQIRKKLSDRNPHVQHYALMVLEACVKNCSTPFHDELVTRAFMEELRELVKAGAAPLVKNKVLELVQAWSHGFRNEPSYRVVQDTYNAMRMEGFQFPELKESDTMFSAEKPPEWISDSSVSSCHLCHTNFGVLNRRHHCRNCGHIFCGTCSSKETLIPKFGFELPVRVCDTCHNQLTSGAGTTPSPSAPNRGTEGDLPLEYLQSSLAQESQAPPARNQRDMELQEEEELQIALAMSLNEEENKKAYKPSSSTTRTTTAAQSSTHVPAHVPAHVPVVMPPSEPQFEENPEVARYTNMAKESERRRQRTEPVYATPNQPPVSAAPAEEATGEIDGIDLSPLKSSLTSSIQMFVDRMQAVSSQGRSIALDQSVQALFQSLSSMHPPLLSAMEELDEKRAFYTGLEEKLQEAKDARVSLNALRRQHQEKVRQQEAEMEMLAKLQMQQKLELLRHLKTEQAQYLEELQRSRHSNLQQQVHQQQALSSYLPPATVPGSTYISAPADIAPSMYAAPVSAIGPSMPSMAPATLPAMQAVAQAPPVQSMPPAPGPTHTIPPAPVAPAPTHTMAPAASQAMPAHATVNGISVGGVALAPMQQLPQQYSQPPSASYAGLPPQQYVGPGPSSFQYNVQPKVEQLISFD